MTKNEALKSCPFCGQEPTSWKEGEGIAVSCSDPDCCGNQIDTADVCWNTRPTVTPTDRRKNKRCEGRNACGGCYPALCLETDGYELARKAAQDSTTDGDAERLALDYIRRWEIGCKDALEYHIGRCDYGEAEKSQEVLSVYETMRKALLTIEKTPYTLGDLLALIHGDGGHYEAEHGTEQAFCDAIAKYHAKSDAVTFIAMLHENACKERNALSEQIAALQSTRKPENKMNPAIQVDDYVVDAQSVRNLIEQRDVAEKKLAAMPDAVTVPREVLQGVRDALIEIFKSAREPMDFHGNGALNHMVTPWCITNAKKQLATLDTALSEGE